MMATSAGPITKPVASAVSGTSVPLLPPVPVALLPPLPPLPEGVVFAGLDAQPAALPRAIQAERNKMVDCCFMTGLVKCLGGEEVGLGSPTDGTAASPGGFGISPRRTARPD